VKEQVGVKVSIKELDDVLMRDVGGKIAESGRYRSLGKLHAKDPLFKIVRKLSSKLCVVVGIFRIFRTACQTFISSSHKMYMTSACIIYRNVLVFHEYHFSLSNQS
jgi:hypothetical protein